MFNGCASMFNECARVLNMCASLPKVCAWMRKVSARKVQQGGAKLLHRRAKLSQGGAKVQRGRRQLSPASAVDTTRRFIPPAALRILIMPYCKDFASVFGVPLLPLTALLPLFHAVST